MDRESVIVAQASAPGRGARSLLRLSGAETFELLRGLGTLEARPPRGVRRWRAFGRVPCLLALMPAPHSFTGDDSAEIQVVGNPDLVADLERRLLGSHAHARRAAPGEFTWRAFVNGRIDLAQAEGIAAIVAATTDAQLSAARQLVDGGLGRFVRGVANGIADDLALVEAGIDFTDQEDVVAITPEALAHDVRAAIDGIRARLQRTVPIERVDAIPRVVLAGPPNAGKSTLFNALLGRDRTVVSRVAGTTRDAIVEVTRIPSTTGPIEVALVDVAGLDDDASGHGPAMQAAARGAIEGADLIVRCVPPRETAASFAPRELVVMTKGDLESREGLTVSARSGAGLDELRRAIGERLSERRVAGEGEVLVVSQRHEALLRDAVEHLERALETNASELIAANLRLALNALGSITGEIAPDDVLGRVFSKFCVGK